VPPPAAASAVDACDPAPGLAFTETRTDGSCPGRWTLVRQWTANDACGHVSSATQTLNVVDTTPPVVEAGPGTSHCLWPPNHWHVVFTLDDFDVTATDACSGPVALEIAGCASSQPDDDIGDGATTQDCIVLGPDSFAVRSERQGTDPAGRTYAVTVVATDACGNRSEPALVGNVHVPHDQSPRAIGCRDATKVGCRPGQEPPDCGR